MFLSEEMLQQLKNVNTRLSKLEEREVNMEGVDDITLPDFSVQDMASFDIFEAKLNEESFKLAFVS